MQASWSSPRRNSREAVELTQYYSPDAVLMDVVMPELDGISATRQILDERPDQLVILLTGADEEIGMAGLQAGASGYLNKDVDIEALPRAEGRCGARPRSPARWARC